MSTVELTSENFEQTLADNEIVILDFWAAWCGPCKMFAPIFEKASEAHPDVVFGKVNTEQQQQLAASFGIRSIPTIAIFRDEIPIFSQPGMLPENALEDLLTQVKGLDMAEVREEYEKALAEHEAGHA
jgi:thioredoxin 1